MAGPEEIAVLLAQRTHLREQIRERAWRAVVYVLQEFAASGGWYSTAAITSMTAEVVAYVEAAQVQTAQLTDAYLTEVAARLAPTRRLETGGAVDPTTLRSGVTHQGAYGRLADQWRYTQTLGFPDEEILRRITNRARTMVGTDLQLAMRNQNMRWMWANNIDLYRRVIRPEASETGTCALCAVASDRVYYRSDLLPLHPACHCDVLPVVGDEDPGRFLNQSDLDRLYGEAGSTSGQDLREIRVQVMEHGELGPVLTNAAHNNRTAAQAAALTTH